ncbi:MAG: virulence-associated E family protein [Lachnospiraceae bacterium]|nr:virulence-associated E family protein [Lachnospiraceae bacterium]
MRQLAIAYGNNRQAKTWVNKTITFEELKDRLKTTIRTPESAEEYAKFNKNKRDQVKDHGGFVAGALKGGRRKIDTVEFRSMVALDGDRIDREFLENYEANAPYTSVLYTTHSSTEADPRVRLVYPLTRDVTPEEFVAVSRYLAQMLGIDYFDECSYQPNQLMYWPSTPANGTFVFKETEGGWLDPDAILSAHPEWTDPTRLPTSSRESKANSAATKAVQDPLSKEGTVGLFNRVYFPITRAIEEYLSDVYEPTDNENRWHFIQSSSMAGVEIIEEGKFVYSHHAKDPAYLKLCNAFDLVRTHRFGDMDDKASFTAMCELAMQDEQLKLLATKERLSQAEMEFTEADEDWMKHLHYQPRSGVLENSVYNLNLILNNDPDFKNFAFNELAGRIQVTGPLPWDRPEGNAFWRDADTAQLKSIIDIRYLPFSSRNHDVAFTKTADDRHFHPVRDYLNSLPEWDGIERVEDLFIRYLQADDTPYVRAVTRKTFAAAVARVYNPGVKFDCVPVLDGDQGIGKSTIVKDLVTSDYYSETLSLTDMDDKSGAEKLQGFWAVEIGELAGMKKADIEKVKAFLSTCDDKYRPSYGKVVESHPRQCIIIATVNA